MKNRTLQFIFSTIILLLSLTPMSGQIQVGSDIIGEAIGDKFGYATSLSDDGMIVAIGGPKNNADVGHVRVLELIGSTWTQMGMDLDGTVAYGEFGSSVSLSGDGSRLAVGIPGDNTGGTNAGRINIYDRVGSNWVFHSYIVGDPSDYTNSVSFSDDGSRLAIGYPINNGGVGLVRVYEWNGAVWGQLGFNIIGDAALNIFGETVRLSGDGTTLIVSAPYNNSSQGRTKVFAYDGTDWIQKGANINGTSGTSDSFGRAIDISDNGNRVAITSIFTAGGDGLLRVFEWDGSAWQQLGADINGAMGSLEVLGQSVSLSGDGNIVAIGVSSYDGSSPGSNIGAGKILKWNGTSWKDFYSYILGSVNNEEAGASIFLTKDGSRVAIGADGGSSPSTSGRVRVYDLCPSSTIIYVNQSASGSNNGSTWANAFTDLQDALRVAENCSIIQEVWVAEGTYHPHTSDRNISFEIPNDMKILGGFPNTGTPTMADRDWDNNLTILSGDIGVNSDNTDNSFRVVYNNGSTANTRLDGFFIEDGSDHLSSNPIGTGMLIEDTNGIGAQMKVQNCTFRYNRTSEGILTMRSSSGTTVNAQVIDCAFLNNFASNRSAGILVYAYNSISQPEFHNNYFEQNVCSAIGGVFSIISENNGTINPKITNSIFYNNTATSRGGVFELDARTGGAISLDIDHCTFNQNVSDAAAVIWNMSDGASTSEAYFDNCIIWNNDGKGSGDFVNSSGTGADTYLRYSIIDEIDCSAIQSNVNLSSTITCLGVKYNEDPRFEDESAADFRLKFCSPAIDAADPVNFSTDDFDYLTRPVGVVADMGAYEFNANSTIPIFQAATPGLGISTIQADWEFTDNTGWTHYCNCANEELLLSLKENGNNVGTIGVDLTVEVSLDEDYGQGNGLDLTSATYNSYPMWLTMNRYWNVFPANQPTTPVGVRFYFDTSDESDVQTMVNSYGGTFSDYKDFVFYKVDYNAYPHDPSIPLADFHEYTYTSGTPAANEWTDGLMGVDLYAEFQVNSFSGGSAAGNGSSSLPLELLSFTGKMKEKHVTLDWTTAFEINVDGFQIERSTDAVNFRQIGWLSAKNDDSGNISSYDWKDHEVENGNVYYYRLKQLDLDGTYEYSKIVAVKVNGKKQTIEIFPKLVSSHLYVQFENDEKDYLIIINNLQGQKVKEVLTTGNTQLDIMDVPNGSYFISIYNYNRLIHSDKIQKMN